ncbi:MAG: iduronate-2-sulfatase [Balneolaceae bacterium]|nr:MAG: iduronate-2-sulfatase [Balneolaceae bacterium]
MGYLMKKGWNLTPLLSLLLAFLLFSCKEKAVAEEPRPNILFISIDDLNNDLGALGVDYVHTPHLDHFAEHARLFSRHYIQVPSCGPARAALLRGKRPTDERFLPNRAILNTHEEWGNESLPRWFRDHGYRTLSLGKITHYPGGMAGDGWAEAPEELPGAWDRVWVPENAPWETPEDMMHGYANGVPRDRGVSPTWEAYDGPDTSYPDGWVADDAIRVLEELMDANEPWFFGVGFFKPHLPFAAPKKYFDMYDPHDIPVPEDTVRHPAPSSWHASGEMMNNYGQHPGNPQTDEAYARQLRLAYAAATTYVDAQVGKVLDAFVRLGLDENTIVVIWSDHGFALGHQGIWGKHSLYEIALKSPLIIRYPGMDRPGEVSDAIVEAIDIYPTLTDLAGISTPAGLHGNSLRPQLEDPLVPSTKPAFAFFSRGQTSVRVNDWRLIMHRDDEEILGYELFDFRENPEGLRMNPDEHPTVIEELSDHFNVLPWLSR